MSGDFYKEWRAYAEVDYFAQLILLWLSTNSWYRSHYAEISTQRDRDFLEKLRADHTPRNKLFARFDRAISSPSTKEYAELIVGIESLSFALNRTTVFWDDESRVQQITLQNCMIGTNPKVYGALTVHKQASGITISDSIKLTDDKGDVFNGLLEIVYKVRCLLVHGDLEPSKENHDVVRHCYGLLHLMMRF